MSKFRPDRPFWIVVALMALIVIAALVIVWLGIRDAGVGPLKESADFKVRVLTSGGSNFAWKDVAIAITSLSSAFVAGAALLVSMWNTDRSISGADSAGRAQRQRDTNKAELMRLEAQISTFHMPYLVLSKSNNNMAQDLRERLNDPNYRMLVSLFDASWLSSRPRGDQTLVLEICATGLRLKKFIEERAGDVDPVLADHLARASTHFRILWLAYRKKLGTDAAVFERYVYPQQLDVALRADLERIQRRIKLLRTEPETAHPAIEELVLPVEANLPPWPDPPRM